MSADLRWGWRAGGGGCGRLVLAAPLQALVDGVALVLLLGLLGHH